jgi:hypothetical protein
MNGIRRDLMTVRPSYRRPDLPEARAAAGDGAGEGGAVSAQELGQLQPVAAVFSRECAGQLASLEPT